MRELGTGLRELGVAFVDASMVFRDVAETLYYDPCHFSPEGNERLARLVASAFLEHARVER
jgi:hypothetical protein